MREIRYRSKNIRDILVDLKDSSELAVDLAYSAVLFDNAELADEVIDLEGSVNYLQYHARIALMLAAKTVDDAESLVGIFQVVDSAVRITEAATDIARIAAGGYGLPAAVRRLPAAHEQFARVRMDAGSSLARTALDGLDLDVDEGITIIAIRRGDDWILDPTGDHQLRADDVVFARGAAEGLAEFYTAATGEPFDPPGVNADDVDVEPAVESIVDLKNVSELAVGLAYSAALFDSDNLAVAVRDLETRSDALRERLEAWIVSEEGQAAAAPAERQGLFHLAVATEIISDAALDIAEVVFRDVELHPVYGQAIRESNQVITSVSVGDDSDLVGRTITAFEHDLEAGTIALALRRDGDWLFDPAETTELAVGDTLVLAGPRRGIDRVRELAGE